MNHITFKIICFLFSYINQEFKFTWDRLKMLADGFVSGFMQTDNYNREQQRN